jgi:hypothetical protein
MKKASSVLLVLLLLISNSLAGIRGPGKYHGVVIFDRWDASYIYSGVYLMYVSERTKNRLQPYKNRCMRINALEVHQPENPGDGRIGKYTILGPAKTKRAYIRVDGLKLRVTPNLTSDGSVAEFTLEVINESDKVIKVHSNELALTLLKQKEGGEAPLDPSDGPSYAMITRNSFRDSRWQGTSNNLSEGATWTIGAQNALPDQFKLQPRQSRVIPISFQLPAGQYDFLCGYGGGVHGDNSIASNLVAFNVDVQRRAMLVSVPGR